LTAKTLEELRKASLIQTEETPILGNLMDRPETADELDVTPRSLDRWAWRREGPPRFKIGNKVYYHRADVEAWLRKKKQAAADRWGDV